MDFLHNNEEIKLSNNHALRIENNNTTNNSLQILKQGKFNSENQLCCLFSLVFFDSIFYFDVSFYIFTLWRGKNLGPSDHQNILATFIET